MNSKRKILDKSHPVRQHVIDFTDLTSDTEHTPEVHRKSPSKKVSVGQLATPTRKHDVKPNFTTSQHAFGGAGQKAKNDSKKGPHSPFKGASLAEPIEIDDSEDEPLPQVRKPVSNATPITQPSSSSKPVNGANTRPVFRHPSGLPPSSSDGGKDKQKQPPSLPNVTSQPSSSRPLVTHLKASFKASPATTKTNGPNNSSTKPKQTIRDTTSTPKPTPKAVATTNNAPAVAIFAKPATTQGQIAIPNADKAKILAKPSPQGTNAASITTSVAFRPASDMTVNKSAAPTSEPASTLISKIQSVPIPDREQITESTRESTSESLDHGTTARHSRQHEPRPLSRASRKTVLETKPGNGHMKKKVPESRRSSKQSISRESTIEPTKQKQKPPTINDSNTSRSNTEANRSSAEKPISAKSMPPPLKPSRAERTDVLLPTSPLERSSHAAFAPDSAITSTVSKTEGAAVVKPEDDSTRIGTDNVQEHEEESMHEPHDSIEVEIVTVFMNQLDLYKAEHQELTKKLLGQDILRRRNRQLHNKPSTTGFSFQSVKGVPIGIHKKSPASAPVRQLLERKAFKAHSYKSNVVGLPNFMVHTPLMTSYLTENVQRLNTETYATGLDDDEDLNKELHRGYKIDTFHDREQNGIAKQRAKQISSYLEIAFEKVHFNAAKMLKYILEGKVHFNTAKMLKYLLDYQHAVEWIPKETVHHVIKEGSLRRKWAKLTRKLPELSEEDIETANRICQTFYDSEHTSIWYLVNHLFDVAKKNSEPPPHPHARLWTKYRCRVCHVHHCFEHGTFLEEEDEEAGDQFDLDSCASDDAEDISIDSYSDDENVASINRALIVRPRFTNAARWQVLAYKWSDLPDYRSGIIDIMAFPGSVGIADPDDDNAECSETCFWLKQNRASASISPWTDAEAKDFKQLLADYGSSNRGPCFISMAMGKPCIEVFIKMLRYTDTLSAQIEDDDAVPLPKKPWYFFKEPEMLNHRQLFVPCNHAGECKANVCSCFDNNVPCEKTCACSKGCARRFQGCTCKRQGRICWQDRECACFRFNRECDEDLCGTCGADEALDPLNRDKALENVCTNVHLQRGDQKRTLVGISEISGFGLFMAEKAKVGDFIGEYKGQITSEEESSRRGRFYAHCTAFYEFSANPGKVMDGTKAGNSTRFINHAQRANVINLEAKLLLCNTVVRLGFCATRDIKPGEELFFDYGIKEHTGQTLLEKKGDELVPVEPRRLQVVRTKIKKSGKDKKKPRSTGTEAGMLNAITGSSPKIGAFTLEPGSESDVDPMELDVPLPVEDPEDTDYVEKVGGGDDDDDAEATKRKIILRRKRENWGTQSDASGSPAGSFKTRRSARRSVSRPASPLGSHSRSMKRKRGSKSD